MGNCKLLSLFFLFCTSGLLAQSNTTDTAIYETALENASSKSFRVQRGLYIGRAYPEKPYAYKNGSAFFLGDSKMTGEVHYNDIQYKNIPLQYDLLLDEVVVEHVNGRRIILVKDKVKEFTLGTYFFKKLGKSEVDEKMTPGYYNILTDAGGLQLLAKRQALERRSKVGFNKQEVIVEQKSKYFLKKDRLFFEVKNHKTIAKILQQENQKASFRVDKSLTGEGKMISVVNYYAKLKK